MRRTATTPDMSGPAVMYMPLGTVSNKTIGIHFNHWHTLQLLTSQEHFKNCMAITSIRVLNQYAAQLTQSDVADCNFSMNITTR